MLRLLRPPVNTSTTAITTAAAVKEYMGETGTADDTRIGNIVQRVNMQLYRRMRDRLLTQQNYDYLLDGPYNQKRLYVPELPIVGITKLENGYMGSSDWAPQDTFTAAMYTVDTEAGLIELKDGKYFSKGRQVIRLTWSAGYATLPADIVHAATVWAVNIYQEIAGNRMDVASVGFETGATAYLLSNLTEDAALTIERYRRRPGVV